METDPSRSARYSIETDAERAGSPHPNARYSIEESERHARTQRDNQNLDDMIENSAEKMDLTAYLHNHPVRKIFAESVQRAGLC